MQEAGVLSRISDAARASRSELLLVVLLGAAIVGAGMLVILRSSEPPAPPVQRIAATPDAPAASPSPAKQLVVHVSGQVASPGVYSLPEGSRVQDAIAAAGGPAAESDANALNLAAVLVDGQKVTIPKPGEPVAADPAGGGAVEGGMPAGKVNLNTATAQQLEELPGVGPVLAERIVAHRTKSRFTSTRQLMEVSGFGPKKYEALKDLIAV